VADHPVERGWNGWGWGGEGGWFASHNHPVALGTNEACFPVDAASGSLTEGTSGVPSDAANGSPASGTSRIPAEGASR
jgi:hypothetical protein